MELKTGVKLKYDRQEVGTEETKEYTVTNKSLKWPMKLELKASDRDIEFNHAEMIQPGHPAIVKVISKPKLKRDESIKTKIYVTKTRLIG